MTSLVSTLLIWTAAHSLQSPPAAGGPPPAPGAQMPAPGHPPRDVSRTVFVRTLKHINADVLKSAISAVMNDVRVTAAGSGNNILVAASASRVDEVNSIIDSLDKPQADEPRRSVEAFPVRHRTVRDMVNQLEVAMDRGGRDRDARLAGDDDRNLILASGSSELLQSIEQLLTRLDTPLRSIPLEFAILTAVPAGGPEGSAAPGIALPADLKSVGNSLAAFGDVKFLGRLTVNTRVGETFKIDGTVVSRYAARVQGRIATVREEGSVDLKFEVALQQSVPSPNDKAREHFSLESTVTCMVGETLVLGSAPNGGAEGESIVIVLRMEKPRA